jgi:RimJ/RimL family protein N-acetyltransferase
VTLPTLRTARLLLRPFERTDAAELQRLAGAWEVASTTLTIPHPYERAMAEDWIAAHRSASQRGEQVVVAITEAGDGALLGAIGLVLALAHERAELGYWIGVPYWNRGYCTEAAGEFLRFGFEELRLNKIYASHFVRNAASGRVLQKIGMLYEGRRLEHVKRWDRFEDLETYAMLRREWLASREQ